MDIGEEFKKHFEELKTPKLSVAEAEKIVKELRSLMSSYESTPHIAKVASVLRLVVIQIHDFLSSEEHTPSERMLSAIALAEIFDELADDLRPVVLRRKRDE